MIIRLRRRKQGLSQYLRSGKRKDSIYTREEKDNIISLYGNLDTFERTEIYLNRYKNYKDNYAHITIGFSSEDEEMLSGLDDFTQKELLENLVTDVISHHTSGYDIENEVIAYSEMHQPKIKFDENNNQRYTHIHIGIMLYNPLDDTQLKTTFANNSFIDDVLQAYCNKKYNLSHPRDNKRENNQSTKIAHDRQYYQTALKDIKNYDELIAYFSQNNINYKEINTTNNHYFKIITQNDNINLRGRGFAHLQNLTKDNSFIYPKDKSFNELSQILHEYQQNRKTYIYNRKSQYSKAKLKQLQEANPTPLKPNTTDKIKPNKTQITRPISPLQQIKKEYDNKKINLANILKTLEKSTSKLQEEVSKMGEGKENGRDKANRQDKGKVSGEKREVV